MTTVHPTHDEQQQYKISTFKGVDVGLGVADPVASIAAKLEAQYPNHLILVQAGKFLHGYKSLLTAAALRGYIPLKCFKTRFTERNVTPSVSGIFCAYSFLYGRGGAGTQYPQGKYCSLGSVRVLNTAPTHPLQNGLVDFKKSHRGAIMANHAQGTSVPTVFNFESKSIRTAEYNGEIWFVAADICIALGIGNPTKALRALDQDEQALTSIQGLSRGNDKANIVNESGLYTLILRCRDAVKSGTAPHRFRKWVTSEVLPAIRQTGSYGNSLQKTQPTAEGRWLLTVRDGKPCLSPLLAGELVINPEELPALLRAGTSLPFDYFEIIEACNAHLKYVFQRIVAAVEARAA